MPCEQSYRQSATTLNRVLWREGKERAIQARTIANTVEREGKAIQASVRQKVQEILSQPTQPRSQESTPAPPDGQRLPAAVLLPEARVLSAMALLNAGKGAERQLSLQALCIPLEDPALVKANLSVDGVGCKQQKASGRSKGAAKKAKRETVEHQVAHLQDAASHTFTFTAATLAELMPQLQAFLQHNDLLRSPGPLVFFLDGAPDLRLAIEEFFAGRPVLILLDWYHLAKKCRERLSLVLRGKALKDPVLDDLLGWLWLGKVEQAIACLRALPPEHIKNQLERERLLTYLIRHQSEIPSYALRKQLGLRISSNPVEKANDLVVARRQKHKGMSWSLSGSTALAAVTCLALNHQLQRWLLSADFSFQFSTETPPVAASRDAHPG